MDFDSQDKLSLQRGAIFVQKSGQKKYFTFLCRISKSRLSVFILEGGIEPLNPKELNGEVIDVRKISKGNSRLKLVPVVVLIVIVEGHL